MRPGLASAVFAVLAFAWTATAAAETLVVGPGERFAKPSQAARAAKAGDTVLIRAPTSSTSGTCSRTAAAPVPKSC